MDDERHLFLRRANDNPPTYRVKYDGVEVGSISETSSHMTRLTFWTLAQLESRNSRGDLPVHRRQA